MRQIHLYPIRIEVCEEGGFLARCPAIQGCYAEGETIKKAVENLRDVIKIALEYKKRYKKGFSIPKVTIKKQKLLSELNVAVVK